MFFHKVVQTVLAVPLSTLAVLSLPFCSFAAIKPDSNKITVFDVLSLPAGNQLQVAMVHKNELWPDLKTLARDVNQRIDIRWKSLSLMAALSPVQVAPELDYFSQSKDWYMRNASLLITEKYFPDKSLPLARKLLRDKALVVRSAAVEVLSSNLKEEDRDLLWQEVSEPRNFHHKKSLWIRAKIISLLARSPLSRESGMFQSLLKDEEFKIQVASIKALEKIHSKSLGRPTDSIAAKVELWRKFAALNKN